jgi:hypothetical protein
MYTGIRITNGILFPSYFATPYPLPKLDMIAIPDFSAGAMENYGLVTYRDTALLYDELLSSASNKQQVIDIFQSIHLFHWLIIGDCCLDCFATIITKYISSFPLYIFST